MGAGLGLVVGGDGAVICGHTKRSELHKFAVIYQRWLNTRLQLVQLAFRALIF